MFKKNKFSNDLNSNILLLRHGESLFNYEIFNLKEIHDDETLYQKKRMEVKFSERLIDSDLTELGIQQSKNCAETIKNFRIKYLFVSPLIRSLKTCSNLLSQLEILNRDNNNYIKPQVIIHPLIFEKLEDVCDFFSTDLNAKKTMFHSYDWSLFDKIENLTFYYYKFCDNYLNEEGKICKTKTDTSTEKISINENFYCQKLKEYFGDCNNSEFEKKILCEIKRLDQFNTYIESSESAFERIKIFNKTLTEFSSKLLGNEKILTIGHSIFFKHMTLTDYKTEEFVNENYAYLKNCEIISYFV